jgi:Domain of unknown function (DUF4936)
VIAVNAVPTVPTAPTVADVLCVYYKVDAAEHAANALRVRQFQSALTAGWLGLTCELLQRPEATAGIETWMETYRHSDGLTAELIDFIAQAATHASLPEPRHTERFVALR